MLSVRRRRRGRCSSPLVRVVVRSLVEGIVLVVILFSVEVVGAGACFGAESPAADRADRAVGAEVTEADAAAVEPRFVFRVPAPDTHPFSSGAHPKFPVLSCV